MYLYCSLIFLCEISFDSTLLPVHTVDEGKATASLLNKKFSDRIRVVYRVQKLIYLFLECFLVCTAKETTKNFQGWYFATTFSGRKVKLNKVFDTKRLHLLPRN